MNFSGEKILYKAYRKAHSVPLYNVILVNILCSQNKKLVYFKTKFEVYDNMAFNIHCHLLRNLEFYWVFRKKQYLCLSLVQYQNYCCIIVNPDN